MIFTTETGNQLIDTTLTPPPQWFGWRESATGIREEVRYEIPWGWVNEAEAEEIRHQDPRYGGIVWEAISPYIRTNAEAAKWQNAIGEQNYRALLRALRQGATVWIFVSAGQIDSNTDLTPEEKTACKRILAEEKLGFAGWVRKPSQPVPGFVPSGNYDAHGDYIGPVSYGPSDKAFH